MPLGIIKKQPVSLNALPEPILKEPGQGAVSNGDLHANSLRLVHCLLTHGVIGFKAEINEADAYNDFVNLYNETEAHLNDDSGENIVIQEEGKDPRVLTYTENREEKPCISSNYLKMFSKKTDLELAIKRITNALAQPTISEAYRNTLATNLKTAEAELVVINAKMSEFESDPTKHATFENVLIKFHSFLTQIEVKDRELLLRLIGDELADRGNNDYFTLKILEFLKMNGVPITTLLSNHGAEFIRDNEKSGDAIVAKFTDKPSLYGLKYMLNAGFLQQETLTELIDNTYKPTLKILDYELSDDGIKIFSHAPIVFDYIKFLAKQMHVVYNDTTPNDLATTIDKINTQFQEKYVSTNTIGELLKTTYDGTDMPSNHHDQEDRPALHMINTRLSDSRHRYNVESTNEGGDLSDTSLRPTTKNGYSIYLINGHDDSISRLENQITLDSFFGKYSDRNPLLAIAKEEKPDAKFDEYLVYTSENRRLTKTYTSQEIEYEFQATQQPARQKSVSAPKPSPERTGAISGLIATLGSATVIAAVGVPLLMLSIIAPPLGLGLIAFGAILGAAALAIGAGIGLYKAWKTAKSNSYTVAATEGTPAAISKAEAATDDKGTLSSAALVMTTIKQNPAAQTTSVSDPANVKDKQAEATGVAAAQTVETIIGEPSDTATSQEPRDPDILAETQEEFDARIKAEQQGNRGPEPK